MELLYLLYLNGVVKVLLSQQSPTLVSCDISRHCTAHFLSSCVVVEGETMNYIEFFCAQAQKGTRTDLPRKCQLVSVSKRRFLKGKKSPHQTWNWPLNQRTEHRRRARPVPLDLAPLLLCCWCQYFIWWTINTAQAFSHIVLCWGQHV